MKNLSFGSLLVVIAIGAVSAAVTSALLSTTSKADSASVPRPNPDLLTQLESLREENAALSERIAHLELRPAPTERAPANPLASPGFEAEVRAWMASREEDDGYTPVALQSKVEEVLTSIRQQEEFQEQQVKLQRRDEFITSTIAKIAPDLGLTQYQMDEMNRTWVAKSEADAELGRLWNEGIDRENIGELKRTNEEAHQADLQAFLSTEQYESYAAMVRAWRGGDK